MLPVTDGAAEESEAQGQHLVAGTCLKKINTIKNPKVTCWLTLSQSAFYLVPVSLILYV